MVGSCGAYGGERNVQSLLVDKPVDKTPLVKTSRTCSNVIEMDLEANRVRERGMD